MPATTARHKLPDKMTKANRHMISSLRTLALTVPLLAGCRTTPANSRDQTHPAQPDAGTAIRLTIDPDFTGWRDFDAKPGVDGLEVYLIAETPDGQPAHLDGRLLIELYSFRPASADHRNQRLEDWEVSLSDADAPSAFWNSATGMYEVRLALAEATAALDAGEKCVLVITCNTTDGRHLTDDMILTLPLAKRLLTRR